MQNKVYENFPAWIPLLSCIFSISTYTLGAFIFSQLAIIESDSRYLAVQLASILKVCRSMRPAVVLKVIIESAALTDEQKIFACRIANDVGVDFIKTSTGLHSAGGARIEDIKLMKETAPNCKIKAAGGIRTAKQALDMLAAGAERIGTSSGVQIMEEFKAGQ